MSSALPSQAPGRLGRESQLLPMVGAAGNGRLHRVLVSRLVMGLKLSLGFQVQSPWVPRVKKLGVPPPCEAVLLIYSHIHSTNIHLLSRPA